jgi:hypothetical protein
MRPVLVRRRLAGRLLALGIAAAAALGARVLAPGTGTRGTAAGDTPVASRDLSPGDVVTAADIDLVPVLDGLVPPGVAASPVGHVVTAPIYAGETVLDARLGPAGRLGLRPGERAVAIPRPLAAPPLDVGAVVELVAVGIGANGETKTATIEPLARVAAVDGETITLAVPAEVASLVVERQAAGSVEVVLTPWSGS